MKPGVRFLCNSILVTLHIVALIFIELTFVAKALFYYEWETPGDIVLIGGIVLVLVTHYSLLIAFRKNHLLFHQTTIILLIFDVIISIACTVLLFIFIGIPTFEELRYSILFTGCQLAVLFTRLYSHYSKNIH